MFYYLDTEITEGANEDGEIDRPFLKFTCDTNLPTNCFTLSTHSQLSSGVIEETKIVSIVKYSITDNYCKC